MKFKLNDRFSVDSDSDPWKRTGIRVGIYGDPGSTKSYTTAAAFVEPFLEQGGSVVIFQPRAEWHTIKEKFPDVQVVGGPHLQDIPFTASHPKLYADAVVESGMSLIFYTADAPNIDKLIEFVASFLDQIMKGLEKAKRPVLVLLEEANRYAPLQTKNHPEGAAPWVLGRMIGRILEMYRDARKLGIVPISITQRPQDLNFALRQLCNLTLLGMFSTQDVKYLDKEVLGPMRKSLDIDVDAEDLVKLQPAEWIVITRGEAGKQKLTIKRKTPHGADTPELTIMPSASPQIRLKVSDLALKLQQALAAEQAQESETDKLKHDNKLLEGKVVELQDKVKTLKNVRELFEHDGPPGDKKLFASLEQLQKEKDAAERLVVNMGKQYNDLLQERDKLLEEMKAFRPLFDLIIEKVTQKFQAQKIPVEPAQQRNHLAAWLDSPHTPVYAKRFLEVFNRSPPGALFTRGQLAAEAKYSVTSSYVGKAVAFLVKNGLIEESASGLTLKQG